MIRPQTCPVCGKELPLQAAENLKTFPFCDDRCRRIDFFRWCEGKYAIVESVDPRLLQEGEEGAGEV